MFKKILSNQHNNGVHPDPEPKRRIYPADRKYMTIGMPKGEITSPTASQEDEYSLSDDLAGNKLPDSGARRKFSTGSVRDIRDGKGRYDLISPIALASLAKRLEDGMTKYGERNWEKGQNLMAYLDSAIRHINNFITDTMTDTVSAEDHISAAFWNLHSFIHTKYMISKEILPADLDDLPYPHRVTKKKLDNHYDGKC